MRHVSEVRPFITDDSRVVGRMLGQMESWIRVENGRYEHWVLSAVGPTEWLELTLGGVFGGEQLEQWKTSYALPLLQAKMLLRPYAPGDWPGIGAVVGTFLPYGAGPFIPAGYGTFAFTTISQCVGEGEKLLVHLNTGFNYLHISGENQWLHTWGFGSQVKVIRGFHLVGEIFSGDPYVPGTGTSYQVGFRHFFSDMLQIDGTLGEGIAGENRMPLWVSIGVRWVFRLKRI
jgi:hypothetical protein